MAVSIVTVVGLLVILCYYVPSQEPPPTPQILSAPDYYTTAHTEVPLKSTSPEPRGYVLTLKYGGQQGAGVRSLLSQQCWAESFHLPMYIVEPFIEESICGIPSDLTKTENVLRMSDFFDIDHFNEASRNDGYAEVASWEDFLRSAPRKVIVIQERGFLPGQVVLEKETSSQRTSQGGVGGKFK